MHLSISILGVGDEISFHQKSVKKPTVFEEATVHSDRVESNGIFPINRTDSGTAHVQDSTMKDDYATTIKSLREEFRTNGYVRIPPSVFCLDHDTVASCRQAFADLFDGKFETGIYPDEIHWRKGISREDATKEICNGWKANRSVIAKVVCSKALGKLACAIMEWESCRLGQDDVIDKPPASALAQAKSPVGFHQDGAYISDNFVPLEDNCLTMWMALDDADKETGALQYAPGSHLWTTKQQQSINGGIKGAPTTNNAPAADASSLSFHVAEGDDYMTSLRKAAMDAGVDPTTAVASVVTVPAATGQLIIHHQNTWHGSGPNTSPTKHRRALVAHLVRGDVEWNLSSEPQRPHYIYGRYYLRGERVPRDDFFPFTYTSPTLGDGMTD